MAHFVVRIERVAQPLGSAELGESIGGYQVQHLPFAQPESGQIYRTNCSRVAK
jgi:hypothetical protein